MNPLFDGLTENKRGHQTSCLHFSLPLQGSNKCRMFDARYKCKAYKKQKVSPPILKEY